MNASIPALALLLPLFALCAGAAESPVDRPLALTHATLIDPARGAIDRDMTVVVEGERITAVFRTGTLELPSGATVHDLAGQYVVPGLIDSHTHLFPLFLRGREVMYAEMERMLYGGVVAVRDMAGDARVIAEAVRAVRSGERSGPDIHYSVVMGGPHFAATDFRMARSALGYTPGTAAWSQSVTADTDPVLAVARAAGTHASALKLYAEMDPELIAALAAEAHRQGLKVWAHATVYPARPIEVVKAGVDVISHACGLAWQSARLDPAAFRQISIHNRPRFDPDRVDPQSPEMTAMFAEMVRRGTIFDATLSNHGRPGDDEYGCTPELVVALTRAAHRAGVPIAAGTDYGAPDDDPYPALHLEIEYLVDMEVLTPAEALLAATYNGARALGLEADYGSIEPGKLASFVVLDANPLEDIRGLRRTIVVAQRGRLYRRADYEDLRRVVASAKTPLDPEERATIELAIREAIGAEQRAFETGGCPAALEFFADWQPLFVVNGRTLPGKAALRALCERLPMDRGGPGRKLQHHTVHVLSPRAGYSVTHYTTGASPDTDDAGAAQVVSKVWVKTGPSWQIVHFHESVASP
ncbi:MAG: amidohydrolase family protein [Wenzhouxiangella sp.]